MSKELTIESIRDTLHWIESAAQDVTGESGADETRGLGFAWTCLAEEIRKAPDLAAKACEEMAIAYFELADDGDEEGDEDGD